MKSGGVGACMWDPAKRVGLFLYVARAVSGLFRITDLAGEEGFEPSHAGIKIQCLNQLGDSPTQDTCLTLGPDRRPICRRLRINCLGCVPADSNRCTSRAMDVHPCCCILEPS